MSSVYEAHLVHLAADGTQKGVYPDFGSLAAENRVNDQSLLVARFPGTHRIASRVADNDVFQFWWGAARYGRNLSLERSYIFQDLAVFTSGGVTTIEIAGATGEVLLDQSMVAHYSGQPLARFVEMAGETIMKQIVSSNVGALALNGLNGRVLNGNQVNLVTAVDGGRGEQLAVWSCAWQRILENLQTLAPVAKGDFRVELGSNGRFEFEYYPGQLGADRTAALEWSLERGNLASPAYKRKQRGTYNVAVVLGQGEGTARQVVLVYHPLYWRPEAQRELRVIATNTTDTAELYLIGLSKLLEATELNTIDFEVVQQTGSHYGIDYYVGDLGTVRYAGVTETQKVTSATISIQHGGSQRVAFDVRTNDRLVTEEEQIARFLELSQRLATLEVTE